MGELDILLNNLEESSKAISTVNIEDMPLDIQLEYLTAYNGFIKAIKHLDKTARDVVVKATLLGLRKEV